MSTPRLAIVATHPIQYYAPWFAHLSRHLAAKVQLFYLWDFGIAHRHDPGFGHGIRWDLDLLGGYAHQFVENRASYPGTHHYHGLYHPALVGELQAWEPNAILMFGYRFRSHMSVIASSSLRRIPLLFRGDSHLLAEPRRFRPLKRLALRTLFRRFSAFLPVGRANYAYFREFGAKEHQLFHAPHAVDMSRFAPELHDGAAIAWKRELRIPRHHRVVLFAGKLEPKKRPDDLLRAFLQADVPDTTLLIVGAGPLERELLQLAGNHPAVRFAPFQNQSLMPRVYAAADLVVLPSCGPGETWGFALHEACAVGRAVLASNHVGCHLELVRSEENGLVFPAGNADALRDCLREALGAPERLKHWGAMSRKIVSRLSYEESTRGLQAAMDFCLRKSRR